VCNCNGVPVDNGLCSPTSLPLVATRYCTLDCQDNCTWTNLTDWIDCATLFNISADDSMDYSTLSQQLCLQRQCSCLELTDNCDDTDMDSESSSLSNFTSPTWSEACGGYNILFMPLNTTQPEQQTTQPEPQTTQPEPQTTQPEQPTTQPEPQTTQPEPQTTQPEQPTTQPEPQTTTNTSVMALSSEEWKNCSCTWPLNTAERTFACCNFNWFQLLNKQNPNDWESLAVEYITAELNLLNGAEPNNDSLYTVLNTTMDLLEICPGNWTQEQTYNAQQLKSTLQQWNEGGSWGTPMTVRMSAGNEDEKGIIIKTSGASKTSLLLVLIPTITVAILVFVGALIFINIKGRPTQDSNEIETANNI